MCFLKMLPWFKNSEYNALWSFLNKEKESDCDDVAGPKYKSEPFPFWELAEKSNINCLHANKASQWK